MFEDPTEILHTIAEVAIAFVGFSTVVAALRARNEATFRIYSIRDVAVVGLCVLGGALLPLTVGLFTADTETIWRASSALFCLVWIISAVWGIRSYNQAVPEDQLHKALWTGPVAGVLGNALLLYNIAMPSSYSAALYVVALILLLIFMSVSFVVATFYNLGSSAEKQSDS